MLENPPANGSTTRDRKANPVADAGPKYDRNPLHVMMTVNAAWNIWNFRRGLVAALLGDGHEVTVLAPADGSESRLQEMGCRFITLPMKPGSLNPFYDLGMLRAMDKVFARERPDVVLGYTIKNNLYGAMAAKRLGIPFVPNVTGLGTAFLSGGALEALAQKLYRFAFASLPVVFFQNEDDEQLFVERKLVRVEQARVLPGSGVDLTRFTAAEFPPEGSTPTFLMLARLLRDKGVLEFVEAARLVRTRWPNARFQLIGEADADNRTAISLRQVREWESSHGIEYLGPVEDVRPHIAAAHCIVLPSYREGAPRTLIEAAAVARPLIATDVPGCRAVVDAEVSGLLCKARDAKDLARTCLRFLALPRAVQIAMGRAARRKIEREYDQQMIVRAYREAIDGLYPRRSIGPNHAGREAAPDQLRQEPK